MLRSYFLSLSFFIILVQSGLGLVQITSGDVGDLQITSADDECANFCSKTYPAHTFDHSGAEQSCKQGCRLFSIISAVDKVKPADRLLGDDDQQVNTTAIKESCTRECAEAYSDKIYHDACVDGCGHQTVFKTGQISMVVNENSPLYPFANRLIEDAFRKFGDVEQRMKSQFENFRNWFKQDAGSPFGDERSSSDEIDEGRLMSSFQRMSDRLRKLFNEDSIDSDESGVSQEDTGKKQRLLGGPEDIFDHLPKHGLNRSDIAPLVITGRMQHIENGEYNGQSSVGNEDDNGEPILFVKLIPTDEEDETVANVVIANEPSPPTQDVMYGEADDGWLACLARRTQNLSIMSRWLLCAALMLSILCMFWLCLALMRNQRYRRGRLYTQYKSGKSDVVYFMPPPVYEKFPTSAAYVPLEGKEQKAPPSPPPAYEMRPEATEKVDIGKVENGGLENEGVNK